MGLADENRQRRGSYFLWRELNAPATIEVRWNPLTTYTPPAGFRATIARRGEAEIPSYALSGYRLVLEALGEHDRGIAAGDQLLPHVAPNFTAAASWQPPSANKTLKPSLRFVPPPGLFSAEKHACLWAPRRRVQDESR